jgi:dolichyl-diphosphooligosaccharide--protein glycosyltransferase
MGGAGLIGFAVFYFINPALLSTMLAMFGLLNPSGGMRTISETAPILFPEGDFTFIVVWLNFTTGSVLALIALGIAVWVMIKKGEQDKTFLVVWSVILLIMTLSMRRWAYYFAVNVSLLTAFCSWLALQRYFDFKEKAVPQGKPAAVYKKTKNYKKIKESKSGSITGMQSLGIVMVLLIVILPNIIYARDTASQPRFAPSNAWCESLEWLKENTPEPFGSSDFYYKTVDSPFTYPDSAYGVTAWWDYGYWITRIGHRIPSSNPGQGGAETVAKFFTALDEKAALEIADTINSKYIIIDFQTTTSKFYAMPAWAGTSRDDYYEMYYQMQSGTGRQVLVFYPEYYKSLAVRLYNFDGRETAAKDTIVISYEERSSGAGGQNYKLITNINTFNSFEEAEAYIEKQKSGLHRIAGTNPFISPVPLEALTRYKTAYNSRITVNNVYGVNPSEVKIFERIDL